MDPALELEIREKYWAYQQEKYQEDDWIQDCSLEDVEVEYYFGNQSGYEMISMMSFGDRPETMTMNDVQIAGFLFTFPTGQACDRVYAYKDGVFVNLRNAYKEGLLSDEDIYRIGINGQKFLDFQVYTADLFTDVPAESWYEGGVTYCVRRNLFAGVSDTAFAPNTTMSRGMFVTVLAKVMMYWSRSKVGLEEMAPYAHSFEDVPSGAWYENPVAWAVTSGIAAGYDETSFGPDDPVTREQMMVMLGKFTELMEIQLAKETEPEPFTDAAELSEWAAASASLFSGYPDGSLGPKKHATRAEVAAVFQQLYEKYITKA